MKKTKKSLALLLILWSIVAQTVQAQDTLTKKSVKKSINYFTLYGGLSFSKNSATASIESIFYKNRGIGITHESNHFVTPNYPKPYSGGLFGDGKPYSLIWFSTISVLQKFSTHHDILRFGTEIGVSLVELHAPIFEYEQGSSWLGSSGYTITSRTTEKVVGVRLRASVDLLVTRYLGLELGIKSNINALHSTFGVDVKFTTGFLRKSIKTQK